MEMLKTNQKEQITVACYKSWKFQRSVIIHGEWGVLEEGGGGRYRSKNDVRELNAEIP